MRVINQEASSERANNLESLGLNGIHRLLVSLFPQNNPTEAHLLVHFHNTNKLETIVEIFDATPDHLKPKWLKEHFPIRGGARIVAGPASDQLKATWLDSGEDGATLDITVEPVGDYSTYILEINHVGFDPIFSEAPFRFRPGCIHLCSPSPDTGHLPHEEPVIDYLAKDYDSFRHTLITAMMERVPGWQPTSEADLDLVLIDLFSAAADELSDFQDRVMNEAFIGTARKRLSLARHGRLMDYHIHQGNQGSGWLAIEAESPAVFSEDFVVTAESSGETVFASRRRDPDRPGEIIPFNINPLLNNLALYTWQGTIPSLAAGACSADIVPLSSTTGREPLPITDKDTAFALEEILRSGAVRELLIEEKLNPATGTPSGRNLAKRQVVRILAETAGATALYDPVTMTEPGNPESAEWFVRITWEEEDSLTDNYCFSVLYNDRSVDTVSLFHGNLIKVYHGEPREIRFIPPQREVSDPAGPPPSHYHILSNGQTLCKLPDILAYIDTPPGGETPPKSTLEVTVHGDGISDAWCEVITLVHSDEHDNHFMVETDEHASSTLRFGDGLNGRALPAGAEINCRYQTGAEPGGKLGADMLVHFHLPTFPGIRGCRNPFPISNGRELEPASSIIRKVPEAYRYRQLRAITLRDYEKRAEELPEVSRASASYAWTGSWRTVRLAIDPTGTTQLDDHLIARLSAHLNSVRLIGEDLEIRPPRYIPLAICMTICIHPHYWPDDIRNILESEFSDGRTADGRPGFFHPDRWSFGAPLKASMLTGRAQAVTGVDHVIAVHIDRWFERQAHDYRRGEEGYRCSTLPVPEINTTIETAPNEILLVKNNPDRMEDGIIVFDLQGGRR